MKTTALMLILLVVTSKTFSQQKVNSLPIPQSIIIDTDPGQDDAIALLFALGTKDLLTIEAITVVSGNLSLEVTERNARIIRDWASAKSIPIYAGCSQPLMREPVNAIEVHGQTGLEGVVLHEPRIARTEENAVAFLINRLRKASPRSITLCTLGPLTNIACAFTSAPEITRNIREIIMMGGAFFERGNITPGAEFNMYVDPQAADIIFRSKVPITVLPRDVAIKAPVNASRIESIRKLGNRCSGIVADLMLAQITYQAKKRNNPVAPMYDPCVIGYLLRPDLFKGKNVNVVVETKGDWTIGTTVVDWNSKTGRTPNANWITDVDADGFYSLLAMSIAQLP